MISREGDVAVLEQSKPTHRTEAFEVVIVHRHNGYEIGGNKFEPGEVMPPPESWGSKGWTCQTKEGAFEKARQVQDDLEFR